MPVSGLPVGGHLCAQVPDLLAVLALDAAELVVDDHVQVVS